MGRRTTSWRPGQNRTPAVIVNVLRQPGSNVIAVVDGIRALLPRLQATIPAAVDVTVLSDRTTTIRASVDDVEFELGLAVVLVVLVIFLFLRNLPATIIPSLSVPLSLVGTLAAMYLLGFSLDNLSLMALTISTGFVVDDAIVMIENIARHVEDGDAPLEAALKGSEEIGFTIISLTVSLIAVLIPLLFMGDVVGRLFNEFAVTLSVTIVLSAVVSLTLVPMMCALLVKHRPAESRNRLDLAAERAFDRLIAGYGRWLGWVLDHQVLTLLVASATFAATVALYVVIPKGFFPVQDTGVIQGISEAAQDTSFSAMATQQQAMADVILQDPAVESLSSFIGVDGTNTTLNAGRFQINLKPKDERGLDVTGVIGRLQGPRYKACRGSRCRCSRCRICRSIPPSAAANTISFWRTRTARCSRPGCPNLVDRLSEAPAFSAVASDMNTNGRALDMVVDRPTAARFGITPATIDNALYDAFGQRIVSTLYTQSNQYRVILQASVTDAASLQRALAAIYLPSATATTGQVPLAAMVHVSTRSGPLQVEHLGQFPGVSVSFNLAAGFVIGRGGRPDQPGGKGDLGCRTASPPSIKAPWPRSNRPCRTSCCWWLAALVAVYLVLGVLYESFIHPLTILSTLPSAGVGALLALDLTGHDLDIIGIIGIILLIGIVKKNAIMMIDFALSAEREEGKPPREAIYQACLLRFRPILMTTMAALLGAMPLMLGTGSGSELRRPAGHRHRRRPAGQPVADAVHHAGNLPDVRRDCGAPHRAPAEPHRR